MRCPRSASVNEWVVAHMNASWHIWMRHGTYECVMAHMNESWHIWMRHGTYECVMARMNESWHIWMRYGTYEWVMAHMNESFHIWMRQCTYEWVMAHMNASWLICPMIPGTRLVKADCPATPSPTLQRRYRSIVGSIGYLVQMTRCDMAFAYSEIPYLRLQSH